MRCQKVIDETWELLGLLGIDERRLRLKWISASEGAAFAEEIRVFVEELKELGLRHTSERRDLDVWKEE